MEKTTGLGEVGRIRLGRVDTGELIFGNEPMASAELVRRGLTNAGFRLVDAHWFEKVMPAGRPTKYVVNLTYVKGATIAQHDRETTEAMRALASTAWFCHVWLNPGGVVTANFVGLQDGSAKQELVVRNKMLTMVAVGAQGSGPNGIDLNEVETVLVKFYFTNPTRIPKGIRRLERLSDDKMDQKHAREIK